MVKIYGIKVNISIHERILCVLIVVPVEPTLTDVQYVRFYLVFFGK